MGWSWAPFLAHSLLVDVLDRIHGVDEPRRRMVHGVPVPTLRDFDIFSWAYMDDYGALTVGSPSSGALPVETWASRTRSALRAIGLDVHKETLGEGVLALGASVEPVRPYTCRVPRTRCALVASATTGLLSMPVTHVRELQSLLGQWTWILLFARASLAILDVCYEQARCRPEGTFFRLSVAARNELQTLIDLLPLFATDMETPWSMTAFAVDSSDSGYGVVSTTITPEERDREGSLAETRGWTVALETSYTLIEEAEMAPPERDLEVANTFSRPNPSHRIRTAPIDGALEAVERWRLTYAGLWRKTVHTNINELRVIVGSARHLSRARTSWRRRILVFTDSLVALGAASKGRSSSPPLLRLCRQLAAVCLTYGIIFRYRYIASEVNPSDGPSRGLPVGAAPETKAAHSDRRPG